MNNSPVKMGPNAVTNPAQLISMVKSQQAAPNPNTPQERVNPDQEALQHIKAAQVSLERAKVSTNDPHMLMVFDVIAGTLAKALLKFDGAAVLQALQESLQSLSPMGAPAPGMGPQPPMGGPPQMGSPMGAQAAPTPPPGMAAA